MLNKFKKLYSKSPFFIKKIYSFIPNEIKYGKVYRYHRKIIPIYKVNDSQFMTMCKDIFNRFRTLSINIISSFNRSI